MLFVMLRADSRRAWLCGRHPGSEQHSDSPICYRWLMLLLFLVLALLPEAPAMITAPCIPPTGNDTGYSMDYGVVIDAGSSGSRVHVYRWMSSNWHIVRKRALSARVPQIEETCNYKVKIRLSALAGVTEAEVEDYVAQLLAKAREQVPEDRHRRTPLYLMATAGEYLAVSSSQRPCICSTRNIQHGGD